MANILYAALGILSGLAIFLVLLLLFKQYRRYTRVSSRIDTKLVEIKESVEPWLSMRFGHTYVYPRKFGSNVAYQKFIAMLDMGFTGFWISSADMDINMSASQRAHVETGLRLSMARGNDTISPSKLDLLLKRIMTFSAAVTDRNAEGVVLISGLGAMYRRNDAGRVRNFLTRIKSGVSGSRVMVLIDLDAKQITPKLSEWVMDELPKTDEKKNSTAAVKVKRPAGKGD